MDIFCGGYVLLKGKCNFSGHISRIDVIQHMQCVGSCSLLYVFSARSYAFKMTAGCRNACLEFSKYLCLFFFCFCAVF